jgi:cysteine-rich repeat protein
MPRNLLVLALVLPSCSPLPVDQADPEKTTGMVASSGGSSSTGEVEDDGSIGSTSAGDTGSTSGSSSSTSTGEENSSSGSSSSTTGEGSSSSTGAPGMVCGDGVEDLYEACDDGNDLPGDGCSDDCKRWDWFGIAKEVPEVELVGWSPCWSSTYSEVSEVSSILEACTAPQVALGCRPKGAATLTFLAHGPRDLVTHELEPLDGTYSEINGTKWQWATDKIAFFNKQGAEGCLGELCWPRIGNALLNGGRCGNASMGVEVQAGWERVVFQSWF